MKLVFGFVCALFYSFMSFGQITQWTDINYANDSLEGHKLDIYLPDGGQTEYKVVVLIYGSAWFANNMKQMAFQAMGKPLLDGGFAVVSINHRSSGDAKFPAQINDVKAAVRFIRAHADEYRLDTSFIGITGFHRAAICLHWPALPMESKYIRWVIRRWTSKEMWEIALPLAAGWMQWWIGSDR